MSIRTRQRTPDSADQALVRQAVNLIQPATQCVEDCREDVRLTIQQWGFDGGTYINRYRPKAGPAKKTARLLLSDLRSAEMRASELGMYCDGFPAAVRFGEMIEEFRGWLTVFAEAPKRRPARSNEKQRWAAQEAWRLLLSWSKVRPPKIKIDTAAKLAAVLYGQPKSDMRKWAREWLHAQKEPGSK